MAGNGEWTGGLEPHIGVFCTHPPGEGFYCPSLLYWDSAFGSITNDMAAMEPGRREDVSSPPPTWQRLAGGQGRAQISTRGGRRSTAGEVAGRGCVNTWTEANL